MLTTEMMLPARTKALRAMTLETAAQGLEIPWRRRCLQQLQISAAALSITPRPADLRNARPQVLWEAARSNDSTEEGLPILRGRDGESAGPVLA
mmetsp:Transcript_119944/g.373550  ORF Transcript_119944/g.373550 Transcript_119944/m.373550 type:complete len:94 (-) Transcript_119944:1164-1445(-)